MTPEEKNKSLMMPLPRPLVRQNTSLAPISAGEIVEDLLGLHRFNQIHSTVLAAKEEFRANLAVSSKEQVTAEFYRLHGHFTNCFSTVVGEPGKPGGTIRTAPDRALADLRRWYKHDLEEAVRNVLSGREGGLLGVINTITEGLLEEKKNAYFELVFFECIPVDQHARLRLAEELFERYDHFMDPNDPDRKLPVLMAANIEQSLKAFALLMHAVKKLTQW